MLPKFPGFWYVKSCRISITRTVGPCSKYLASTVWPAGFGEQPAGSESAQGPSLDQTWGWGWLSSKGTCIGAENEHIHTYTYTY